MNGKGLHTDSILIINHANKKPGYYIMYLGDDTAISSGVTTLFVFSVLAKPRIRPTEIWSVGGWYLTKWFILSAYKVSGQ
jgi:hypothetical protein